jgi:hypothetical protein
MSNPPNANADKPVGDPPSDALPMQQQGQSEKTVQQQGGPAPNAHPAAPAAAPDARR